MPENRVRGVVGVRVFDAVLVFSNFVSDLRLSLCLFELVDCLHEFHARTPGKLIAFEFTSIQTL